MHANWRNDDKGFDSYRGAPYKRLDLLPSKAFNDDDVTLIQTGLFKILCLVSAITRNRSITQQRVFGSSRVTAQYAGRPVQLTNDYYDLLELKYYTETTNIFTNKENLRGTEKIRNIAWLEKSEWRM